MCFAGHRVYGHIAFMKNEQVFTAEHLGMPFGAVASVHAWHRIGERQNDFVCALHPSLSRLC